MRKASKREQEFFNRLESHPAYQLLVSFFALIGFSATMGFVITQPTGTISVVKTVVLVLVGMAGGYILCRVRYND